MARLVRRYPNNTSPNHERWLVSYADYMTLMFALFVVLYATAIVKEESFTVLSQSLGEIFQLEGDKGSGVAGDGILTNQVSEQSVLDGNSIAPEKGPELTKQDLVINESSQKKLGNPLNALQRDMQSALYELTENGLAKLELDDDWLTIEMSSGLLFGSGSANPSAAASVIINEIGSVLTNVDNLIEIRGYTDNLKINNEIYSSNWQLSAARAASITNLLEQAGIIPERLSIKANGENEPVASNETEAGRAQNRRVVIGLSKYAFNPEVVPEVDKELLQKNLSDNITHTVEDYKQIQVIKLPNGGIRITTRKSEKDKEQN